MIIGGVVLLVGIGLFVFATASLVPPFEFAPLAPGAFQNRTVDVQQAGSVVTYLVQITEFAPGDELTVFIQTPSGGEVRRTTVNTAAILSPLPYMTIEPGPHRVVIQNTGTQSVTILWAAGVVGLTTLVLLFVLFLFVIGGFIVLIIGLILWIVDRGRRRREAMETPPPPS